VQSDLLILDDFGMREFSSSQAEDLYELICERYRSGSMIVTSNRPPRDWYALFPNAVLAESALDRLVNSAHHVVLRGRTYRPLRRPDGGGVTADIDDSDVTPPEPADALRFVPLRRPRRPATTMPRVLGRPWTPISRLHQEDREGYDRNVDGAPKGGSITWRWVASLRGVRQLIAEQFSPACLGNPTTSDQKYAP
jgi:IstB-like ATP binding protein